MSQRACATFSARCCWRSVRRTPCSTTTSPPTWPADSRIRRPIDSPARTISSWPRPMSSGWPNPGWTISSRADSTMSSEPPASTATEVPAGASVWAAIAAGRADDRDAFVDLATAEALSFATLAARVDSVAAELVRRGLQPGDHVAMLTPPGIDLVTAVYGVWRAGGVTVIADRGLGLRATRAGGSLDETEVGHRTQAGARCGDRDAVGAEGAAAGCGRTRACTGGRSGVAGARAGWRCAGRRPVHVRGDRSGEGCALPAPPTRSAARRARRRRTRSPVTIAWSRPSLRSRSTARRWGSPLRCLRVTSPSPAS